MSSRSFQFIIDSGGPQCPRSVSSSLGDEANAFPCDARAAEREASLKANSDALKMSRENARQREAARKQEAEEHKQLLRERAADYRTNKELAKASAFTR